jgi:flagellar biosynthesis anti-sigma factor FlgM
MKINDIYTSSQAAATYQSQTQRTQESAATSAVGSGKTANSKGVSGSDEVSLSELANVLQEALTETPERSAYLEKLSKQFEAGTYKVDSRQIAGSLIDETIAGTGK